MLEFSFRNALQVGHAGTLDPMATGLLLLATGRATKLLESFMSQDKEYTGPSTPFLRLK